MSEEKRVDEPMTPLRAAEATVWKLGKQYGEMKTRAEAAEATRDSAQAEAEELRARVAELEEALHDRKTWSFDTLRYVGERLVTEFYPEDIFPDRPEDEEDASSGWV